MAWTYDVLFLDDDSVVGDISRLRFLLGDTDTNDQQMQDEEIQFILSQHTNLYLAASVCAGALAAKYSRQVTTALGQGAIEENASDLSKAYRALQRQLRTQAMQNGASTLALGSNVGVSGLTNTDAQFTIGQFDYYENLNVSKECD